MTGIARIVVIGEDGGHSELNGSVEDSAVGIERRMVTQRRSGYIARVEPDDAGGMKLTMIQSLNAPNTSFDDVQQKFFGRMKSKGRNNTVFSKWGHRRIGGPV